MAAPSHHLRELTGARFVAAAVVFFAHLSQARALPTWLLDFEPHGRAAVCFFFVLSGFILAYTYRHRMHKEGLRSFFISRFARIYPIYFVTLVLAIPVALFPDMGIHHWLRCRSAFH